MTKLQIFDLWETMTSNSDMKKQTLINSAIDVFYNGVSSDDINCYLSNLAYTFHKRYA
jgi:hypothetical protein